MNGKIIIDFSFERQNETILYALQAFRWRLLVQFRWAAEN